MYLSKGGCDINKNNFASSNMTNFSLSKLSIYNILSATLNKITSRIYLFGGGEAYGSVVYSTIIVYQIVSVAIAFYQILHFNWLIRKSSMKQRIIIFISSSGVRLFALKAVHCYL